MATRIPARLTPDGARQASVAQAGRRFGLVVGTAFLALAGFAHWRGGHTAVGVLGILGGALALAGLVIPGKLGPVERVWMALAHAMSRVTTPVFMGLIYFIVFTPVGLVRRALGKNALVRPASDGSYWVSRAAGARRSDLERQF